MSYFVSILSEAAADIANAYIWYESKQLNLGKKFYKIVEESINTISKNPTICEEIYKGVRRFVIRKFPYGIYYKVNLELKEIQILGILHFKRNEIFIKHRL
jgi:toxin ParE1/3/4